MSSAPPLLKVALALAGLALLAAVAPPLVGVAVAAAGAVVARREPASRPLGIALVVAGLAAAAFLALVLYGTGSGGPLHNLP